MSSKLSETSWGMQSDSTSSRCRRIPRVDLPDLKPFLRTAVQLNGRKVRDDEGGMGFLTPEEWKDDAAVGRVPGI